MRSGSKANRRKLAREVLTSLPRAYKHTAQLPPDDIPKEIFDEVQTGDDFAGQVVKVSHNLVGAAVWIGIISWTIFVWGFAGTPVTDLLIALGVWVATFVFTVVGVPAVRRTARGRARK